MAPLRQHMKKRPWTLWQVGCLKAISVKNHHLITIGKTSEPRARRTVNKISAARFLKLFMKLLVLNLDVLSFPFQLLKNCETDFNFTFISQGQSFILLSKKEWIRFVFSFNFPPWNFQIPLFSETSVQSLSNVQSDNCFNGCVHCGNQSTALVGD